MLKKIIFSFALFSSLAIAQERELAVTIDDLPLMASKMNNAANRQRATERFTHIVQAFEQYNVPATGFVVAGAIQKGQWAFLEQFRAAGLTLGSHSYSHYNLNTIDAGKFIADVERADKILGPIMTTPKYFRYPFLAEGNKNSKEQVRTYLKNQGYTIAPVTIDSKDYAFNERLYKVPYRNREHYIKKIKAEYLAFIWKRTLRAEKRSPQGSKQILLIHANLLNSYLLGDVLDMYQKNGYKFIGLTEALKNPGTPITFPNPKKEI